MTLEEIDGVPAGLLAFAFDEARYGAAPRSSQRHGRRESDSVIFMEGDIEDPMHPVLDPPMTGGWCAPRVGHPGRQNDRQD